MFNTIILDVAIGMIFIYLLLSLMCTAATEIIELMLKKRAIDLERGIRELLVPGSNSGSLDIVRDLYNHPLINGLFGGLYEDSRIATRVRWVRRTALPSYIPARNFSLALMDIIRPGVTPGGPAGGPSGSTDALAPPPFPASPAPVVVNVAAGPAPVVVPPPPPVPNPSLTALRDALLASPQITERIKQGLIPLLDAAGNDMARVRENIEGWYNASMDRVSSWYKRRAQVTILILGLFIAITLNVDTITVAKRLSTDKALRESLVAASDAYAKANTSSALAASKSPAEATANPSESRASPAARPNRRSASAATTPAAEASPPPPASAAASPSVSSSPALANASTTPPLPPACVKDEKSADCKRELNLQKIQACVDDRSSPPVSYTHLTLPTKRIV